MSVHAGERLVSLLIRPAVTGSRDADVAVYAGTGAASGGTLPTGQTLASTQEAIRFRSGASAVGALVEATVDGGTTWAVPWSDLNTTFDLDVALTGTGDGANMAVTMSHATQSAEGLDVTLSQITNARTSGVLSAVKSTIVSLTGSTAGTDVYAYEAAVTVGAAAVDHFAFKQGAGFDWTLDLSACATTEAGFMLGANLASALRIGTEALTTQMVFRTTTAAPGIDETWALSGTGDAHNIAATMSHATQSAEALDVSIAQITNARTSGDLIAIKAGITSLNGSTAGVDHVAFAGVVTAGDADSDHILLRQGAGFSHTIDLRACATGEGVVAVADNLASAFVVKEGSTEYIKVVTTNSGEGVVITGARQISATAAAIAGVTTLTSADSGGCFSVAKTSAYTITLPAPAQGMRFKFMILDAGANIVTIASSGANLYGQLSIANVATQVNGSTNVLSAATASIGDWVEFEGIDSTHYLVTGACKDAADLSVS